MLRAAWFVTRNYMEELLPVAESFPAKLLRAAVIGFTASAVSDTCSNSVRVLKTTRQTAAENLTYPQALRVRAPSLCACAGQARQNAQFFLRQLVPPFFMTQQITAADGMYHPALAARVRRLLWTFAKARCFCAVAT